MKVRYVHGDVHEYLLVPETIEFQGKKHHVQAAVNPHLTHPVIWGMNWLGFKMLLFVVGFHNKEVQGEASMVLAGEAVPNDISYVSGRHRSGEVYRSMHPHRDSPLEQIHNETLRHILTK